MRFREFSQTLTEADEHNAPVTETIRKLPNGKYRLYSGKGRNLGTFSSREAAEKHEREVQFFKHR